MMMNEEQIKTRLVGSIVVVLAIVILIPIFLENKEEESDGSRIQELPPKVNLSQEKFLEWDGSAESIKIRIDSVVESPKAIGSMEGNDLKETTGFGENDPPDVQEKKETSLDFDYSLDKLEASIENQLRKSRGSEKNSESAVDWIVQVGSFSNEDNANQLVKKLNVQSFNAFVVEKRNDGESFRVRIGPFDEKNQAMKVLSMIEEKFGFVGFLIKIRPFLMVLIDYVIIVIFFLSVMVGFFRGFTLEFLSLVSVGIQFLGGFLFYGVFWKCSIGPI